MALHNGPYYTTAPQGVNDLSSHGLHGDQPTLYLDLGQSTAQDAQMYALADDALHAHQNSSNSHFAGLIKAVTEAVGQDEVPVSYPTPKRSTRRSQARNSAFQGGIGADEEQDGSSQGYQTRFPPPNNTRKRKRGVSDTSRTGNEEGSQLDDQERLPGSPAPVSHSASALFRRSSTTSKKYTRPPMSKLYTSLELSPENFLQLQSAAKNYMLDPNHPERRDTVGQRGRGDSEIVKLRLWNCVNEFLQDHGNGDRFFGPHVPGDEGQARTMFWPSHKNNIISVITPLLRRMVTNERQRQYAVEVRKPGTATDEAAEKKRKTGKQRASSLGNGQGEGQSQIPHPEVESVLTSFFKERTGIDLDEYSEWRNPKTEALIEQILTDNESLDALLNPNIHAIIAIIDHHLRISHGKDDLSIYRCSPDCEGATIVQMIETIFMHHGSFAGGYEELGGLHEKFHSLLTHLFHTLKEILSESALQPGSAPFLASEQPNTDTLDILNSMNTSTKPPSVIHLNVLRDGKRLYPRLTIPLNQSSDLNVVMERLRKHCGDDPSVGMERVKVLLPEGLVEVGKDGEWESAIERVGETEWLDGEVRVVVEV